MLTATVAQAAGFWNLDRGASNYGRGAANIAAPRDPIALYINPAALAGLSGFQFMVDANAINDNRTFTRGDYDASGRLVSSHDPARNTQPVFPPSPGFFATYNFARLGLPELTIGAGGWGPPRSDTTWPHEGEQRYNILESHNLQIHYALGAGYKLPWLGMKVGVTAQLVSQVIDTGLRLNALPDVCPENNRCDVEVWVNARHDYIPTGTLAVSMQPVPWLILAASYQHWWDVDGSGTAKIEAKGEDVAAFADIQGDELGLELRMAPILRLAAQVLDPADAYDVELAFVFEGWSRNERIVFKPKDIVFEAPAFGLREELGELSFPNNWRDTFSVRLGGRYDVMPKLLTVRAGAYYERSAVPEKYRSPGSFDFDKVGGTLGARVDLPYGLWLDLAGGYVHWFTGEVKASNVRLQDPLSGEAKRPIATGTYDNWQVYMLAALGAQLDI